MLVHIVCWKYRPDVPEEAREAHRSRLRDLQRLVPGVERLDVGADVLHLDRSFDTALLGEFADREALDAYNVHPEHQAVVVIGRAIAEKVVSVDFYR
ncbi:MAG TPA: Dabb family protein [Pyrinomonadaceae bacterium]|jgi:hypothetical protein|nr:Dabb family protein [Pyrinomonadaceae bacterium]